MSSIQIRVKDVPCPEGRFNLAEKELLVLLIDAIEHYLETSGHPQGKKIVLNPAILATHVVYGTLNIFHNYYNKGYKLILRRVRKKLCAMKIEQHGAYYILPADIKQKLEKDHEMQ